MVRAVVFSALLGLWAVAGASAQPIPHAPRGQAGVMHHEMMEHLNLTDQQKADIEKLRAEFQKKSIAVQAQIRSSRVDLRQLAMAEEPDRSAIEKTVQDISKLQQQEKLNLVDHLFAVRKVLTPEQRKKWKEALMQIASERPGRMMGRPMMRHERGAGPMHMQGGFDEAPEHEGAQE